MVLKQKDENNFYWDKDKFYESVVTVSILANSGYQFYYSEETYVKLPTRYNIINGKLFYLWDDNYPVTQEMITVLWKFNLLQMDLIIPDFSTDDSQKGADYYFCKNNLSQYKRVVTSIGLGYYKLPK